MTRRDEPGWADLAENVDRGELSVIKEIHAAVTSVGGVEDRVRHSQSVSGAVWCVCFELGAASKR